MKITGARVFDLEGGFVSRDLCFDGDKISASSGDGEVFDADGSPRSLNNPFTAAYGEKRLFEWHLVTEVSGSDPEGWMPLSEFEVNPSIASLVADDTYINAYPGRVESIETGSEESLLRIRLDSEDAMIPDRSRIRVQRTDGEFLEVEYTAVTEEGGVSEFHIPEDLSAEGVLSVPFPHGERRIVEQGGLPPYQNRLMLCPELVHIHGGKGAG